MSGVVGISRDLWNDEDFDSEPFSQREAFIWLVASAAWRDCKVRGNNKQPIEIKRGEFSFSVRFLAEKWDWKKTRVHYFLKLLVKRGILQDTSRDSAQIFCLKNYNKFQVVGLPKADSEADSRRTAGGQQADKEETGKQLNIETKGYVEQGSTPAPKNDHFKEAVSAYNASAEACGWPLARTLNPSRKSRLSARLREIGGLEEWSRLMAKARASPFLRGDTGRTEGHENWRPNLDFFLQPKSLTKLLEGGYDAATKGGTSIELEQWKGPDSDRDSESELREFYAKGLAFIQEMAAQKQKTTFAITPGSREWNAWGVYFRERIVAFPAWFREVERNPQNGDQRNSFTVPAQWPEWFDKTYHAPAYVDYRPEQRVRGRSSEDWDMMNANEAWRRKFARDHPVQAEKIFAGTAFDKFADGRFDYVKRKLG